MNKAKFLPENAKKLFKENSVNGNKNFYLDVNFGNETIAKVKLLPNDVLIAETTNKTTFKQVISIYNHLKEFGFDFNIVLFENDKPDYRKIVSDFAYSLNQKLLSVRSKISFQRKKLLN